jgi:ribosomal peptide maturation radical SAM protein 1
MPWAQIDRAPCGVASLKAYLAARRVSVDCLYLNLRMAQRMAPLAARIAGSGEWAEWLFSQHLFGPAGMGELTERWKDMARVPGFARWVQGLGVPEARLRALVDKDIPEFLSDCLTAIPWGSYDLIGFSSMVPEHTACLALARRIKDKFPDTPIVFGGRNVEGDMGRATLQGCPWVDYVVDGEGEAALHALVKKLAAGQPAGSIPGVSCQHGRGSPARGPAVRARVDMAALPTPDHDDYFSQLERYGLRDRVKPVVTVEASRGCWWGQKSRCSFCGDNGGYRGFRGKAAQAVVRDLLRLQQRHKVGRWGICLCDSALDPGRLSALLPAMKRARQRGRMDWTVSAAARGNLTPEQMRALEAAGVLNLCIGIESLCPQVLKALRKGVRAIDNVQTLKFGSRGRLHIAWLMLYGIPGEDRQERLRMLERIPSVVHLCPPQHAARVSVLRFSPYHEDWRARGLRKPIPAEPFRYIYPQPRFDLEGVANSFCFDARDLEPDLPAYAAELEAAVAFWKRMSPRSFFAFRRFEDYVELYDARPVSITGGAQFREYTLRGLQAQVFGCCETIQDQEAIWSACRRSQPGCLRRDIRRLLQDMTERGWLWREGDRYLTLALPVADMRPAQRLLLDHFEFAAQQAR